MPVKFTETLISELQCPAGKRDKLFFDSEQKGLAIRVTEKGGKMFLAIWKDNKIGQRKKEKLGSFGEISLIEARDAVALRIKSNAQIKLNGFKKNLESSATLRRLNVNVAAIFTAWSQAHGDKLMSVADLGDAVRAAADPAGRGRQYLATVIRALDGTRAAGFVLVRSASVGKWEADRYALKKQNTQFAEEYNFKPNYDPANEIYSYLEIARKSLEKAANEIAKLYPEILRIDKARDIAIEFQEKNSEPL